MRNVVAPALLPSPGPSDVQELNALPVEARLFVDGAGRGDAGTDALRARIEAAGFAVRDTAMGPVAQPLSR